MRLAMDDGVNFGSGFWQVNEITIGSTCLTARCTRAAAGVCYEFDRMAAAW